MWQAVNFGSHFSVAVRKLETVSWLRKELGGEWRCVRQPTNHW